ncbi:hypothetical protein FH972_015292 [Carpinus fangiana]|uniref:Uncharacterized protein n=1 Tax=Carpinus fangiana TaxID=176857 RepID=A0A5N6RE57_9ROSI|nr:hypothetical protein FH972_015292 [Carpinus fangiana]
MKEHQTPRKDYARPSELANRRSKDSSSKKLQKITKKSLNAAFTSVSEDDLESSKESVDLSSISEIADFDHSGEIAESFLMAENPSLFGSSESSIASDLTPSSKITADMQEPGQLYGTIEPTGLKIGSVELEIVVDILKRNRTQVLNSSDVDPQSKKILDALIEIVIEEFYNRPKERDRFAELVSIKIQIVILFFFLWMLAMAVAFFFGSGVQHSSSRHLPT